MNKAKMFFLVLVLTAGLGCIHKTGGSITPWERVTTDNAVLAQFDNTAAQGTLAAQESGLLTIQQAKPILEAEQTIAEDDQQIKAVLAAGPTGDLAHAQALLNQISTLAQGLVNSGGVGVKNPKTQQLISADIQQLIGLANAVLNDILVVKGGA